MTDLANTKAGGIQERDHGLFFEGGESRNESMNLLLGGDKRKILVETAHGKLGIVPGFMQNIESEEAELGNTAIDGAVGKTAGLLNVADKITQDIPGSILGSKRKRIKKIKICADVG